MIALLVAMSTNGCIGAKGALPWHIPEDLRRFRELTTGHTVIMGRKTWESLPERFRPLPNRQNIVITRQTDYAVPDGVVCASTLEEAFNAAPQDRSTFVIGGGEIFALALPHADTLYVTHVDSHVEGDAFFPPIDPDQWRITHEDPHTGFRFVDYTRSL